MAESNSKISISSRSVAVVCATVLFAEILISLTAVDILRVIYKIGTPDYNTPAFIRIVRDAIRQHSILTVVHLFALLGFVLPFALAGFQKGGLSQVRNLVLKANWWIPALCIGYVIIRLTIDYCVVTLASVAPPDFTMWLTYVNIGAAMIGIGIWSLCIKARSPHKGSTRFFRLSLAVLLLFIGCSVAAIVYYKGPTRQIIAVNRAAQTAFASSQVTAMDRNLDLLLISGHLSNGRYFSADFYGNDSPDQQTTDSVIVSGSPVGITTNWLNDQQTSESTYVLNTNRLRSLDSAFSLSVNIHMPLSELQKAAVASEINNEVGTFLTLTTQQLSD